jgi:hypothetical protein
LTASQLTLAVAGQSVCPVPVLHLAKLPAMMRQARVSATVTMGRATVTMGRATMRRATVRATMRRARARATMV